MKRGEMDLPLTIIVVALSACACQRERERCIPYMLCVVLKLCITSHIDIHIFSLFVFFPPKNWLKKMHLINLNLVMMQMHLHCFLVLYMDEVALPSTF